METPERFWQPVTENAYRMLGLAGGALQREIYEAAAARRRALQLGLARPTPCDALWLGACERTENGVRDALGRLARPSQRIRERLFWFSEMPEAVAQAGAGFDDLRAGVEALLARDEATARHDAALLAYASAFRFDGGLKDAEWWARALGLWREVVEREEFWSFLLAADLRGEFEQLATHGEIRKLRGQTLRRLTAPLVELSKDAMLRGDFAACQRVFAVLRVAPLPRALVAEYEREIISPLDESLENRCREILTNFLIERFKSYKDNDNIKLCNETLARFKDEVRPQLRRILELAGAESHTTRRVCETGASYLRQLAVGYPASRRDVGTRLLEKAWALAPPASDAELLIAEELRERGRGDFIKPRTEEEYRASLAHQLRPQEELFASYLKEDLGVKTAESSGVSTMLYVVFGMCVLLGMCHRCTGILKPSPRVGFNTPNFNFTPTLKYTPPNMNFSMPPMPPMPPPLSSKANPLAVHVMEVPELRRKLERRRVVVVDVRSTEEYLAGHIDGAISLPWGEFAKYAGDLQRGGRQLVVYSDEKRPRSYLAALEFQRLGHRNVAILAGGYEAWLADATPPATPQTNTTRSR
jgi:rhodanese-related sulfurtransferase